MQCYRIQIEYDGSAFCGWQRQDGLFLPSVQGEIERAILGFCGEAVVLHGAGRTDSGVHALGMVASFHTSKDYRPEVVRDALNAHLRMNLRGQPVAVLEASKVGTQFHARYSCMRRHYLYRLLCRRAPPTLDKGRVWNVSGSLDLVAMQSAAANLLGQHDFSAFRTSICQAASPIKTLDSADIMQAGDEIHFRFSARSFLHRQVRIMTGTLVEIGQGRRLKNSIPHAFETGLRTDAGKTAPAKGLYFVCADYDV